MDDINWDLAMVKKMISDLSLTGNGLRDWLAQRFSSIVLATYFLTLIGFFSCHPHLNFSILRSFFSSLWIQIFTLISLLSLVLHAWVGIWTVITDYIHPFAMRLIAQVLIILALIIYFFWGVEILWRMA
jgi:succinate dehydrogenase / fumarate reductase membrane anchor subunit